MSIAYPTLLVWASFVALDANFAQADVPTLTFDIPLEGEITLGDPVIQTPGMQPDDNLPDAHGKAFQFTVDEPGIIQIELHAYLFDAYLLLLDARGRVIAYNDDGRIGFQSHLVAKLNAGTYSVQACALMGDVGPFRLTLRRGPPSPLAPEELARMIREDAESRLAHSLEALGGDHKSVVYCRQFLGQVLRDQGSYRLAAEHLELARSGFLRISGPSSRDTAAVMDALADVRRELGEHDEAEALYGRVIEIHQSISGSNHRSVANVLSRLGNLHETRGHFDEALHCHRRTLSIFQAQEPPDQNGSARALFNIGLSLERQGDHELARDHMRRALDYFESALGADHAHNLAILHALSAASKNAGDLSAARALAERARVIAQRDLGATHWKTLSILGSLATIRHDLGDHDGAQQLFEHVTEVLERQPETRAGQLAINLSNHSDTLSRSGDHLAAVRMAERAVEEYERVFGAQNLGTAEMINNLAAQYLALREYKKADLALARAAEIYDQLVIPGHSNFRVIYFNQAWSLMDQGRYKEAEGLLRKCLSLGSAADPLRMGRVPAAVYLVLLLFATGRDQEAWDIARSDADRRRQDRAKQMASLGDSDRFGQLENLRLWLNAELSLAAALGTDEARVLAYEQLLDFKGQVGRISAAGQEQLTGPLSNHQRALIDDLHAKRRRLAAVSFDRSYSNPVDHARQVTQAEEAYDRQALMVSRAIPADLAPEPLRHAQLRDSLPPGSALIDFFQYRPWVRNDPGKALGSSHKGGQQNEPALLAWITKPGESTPTRVELGLCQPIEEAVAAHLAAIGTRVDVPDRGTLAPVVKKPTGPPLRPLVWDPLAAHLEDVQLVFISPDGPVLGLPFETLRMEDDSFLVEGRTCVYQRDASALVSLPDPKERSAESLLAVGSVDFDHRSDPNPKRRPGSVTAASPLRGGSQAHWRALPATADEIDQIVTMHEDRFGLDSELEVISGQDATEERLLAEMPRFDLLHLATHGFYNPDGVPSLWDTARQSVAEQAQQFGRLERRLAGRHPGLLSGLICAGANEPEDGRADGYLTAMELGGLDLGQVRLVVLSACESGLGRAQSGEGLIGLQWAFHTAGADTVISSVWAVEDESTAALLTDFYSYVWEEGEGLAVALRSAQLDMLNRNRERYGQARPSTWGAFVLSGDWR